VTSAKMQPGTSSKDVNKQKPKVPKPITKRKSTRPHVEIEYEYEPAVTTEKSKTSYWSVEGCLLKYANKL